MGNTNCCQSGDPDFANVDLSKFHFTHFSSFVLAGPKLIDDRRDKNNSLQYKTNKNSRNAENGINDLDSKGFSNMSASLKPGPNPNK